MGLYFYPSEAPLQAAVGGPDLIDPSTRSAEGQDDEMAVEVSDPTSTD